MDIEPRDGVWAMGLAASFGAAWSWFKSRLKIQAKDTVELRTRLEKIENRMVTENGEPALMSFRAHNHICRQANELLLSELNHMREAVDSQCRHLEKMSGKLSSMEKAMAVLEEKSKSRREKYE
jgi:hypothetical protein